MIHFCSCTKSSSSPLENPKLQQSLKTCKICGGKLPVDGRGAQQGSMLSNTGLELSRVIDPHLTWKTASNGRQRAVRRARTSFTGVIRKKSPARKLKVGKDIGEKDSFTGASGKKSPARRLKKSKDLLDKDSKSTEDMPVSESEKVGVSILGRRFSDTLGSVPYKKRLVLIPNSPSPPHNSSSYSDDSSHILERQAVSCQGSVQNSKPHTLDRNSGSVSVFGQERKSGFENTDFDVVSEKICNGADFSGISILAAAACDSNIFINVDPSHSKVHPSQVQEVPKGNDTPPQTSEDLVGRTDLPFEISSSTALPNKESNEVKSDGSSNLGPSVNSFRQNVPNKNMESLSPDVKFHWDLNMDACESHEEVSNPDQGTTKCANIDADHNEKLGTAECFMDQVGFVDTKSMPMDSENVDSRDVQYGGDRNDACASDAKQEEKPDVSSDNSASDSKERKPFLSNRGGTSPEDKHFSDTKISVADFCEETDSLVDKSKKCSISADFNPAVRDAAVSSGPVPYSSLSSGAYLDKEKVEAYCVNLHTKLESKKRPSCLVSCDNTIHPSDDSGTYLGVDGIPAEAGTDVAMAEISHTRSPQAVKHELLFVDSGTVKIEGNSSIYPDSEKGSEVLTDANICQDMVVENVISGARVQMGALDGTDSANVDKSQEKDISQHEKISVGMVIDNIDAHEEGMDITKTNTILSSEDACKTNTDSRSNPGQVTTQNRLQCNSHSDASLNDVDQAPGMEKVEFLGDDDSQYEDGEFRESLANCWLDDGVEEGETEHVDYGSDRDADICEAASKFSSANLHVNNVVLPDVVPDIQNQEVGKDVQNTRSFQNRSLLANVKDAGSGKRDAGSGKRNAGYASDGNGSGGNGFVKEADNVTRAGHSTCFRKMSGWDRLPGGCRTSGNGIMDSRVGSTSHNRTDNSSYPSRAGDSITRSSFRRDLSSRIDKMQSSDVSYRNEKPYRQSRSNDCNGYSPRVERDRDGPRSIGRSGPPPHLQGRGRGDQWVDSSNHHSSSGHDTSGYYRSANFLHHSSRNAAAAAVAKVESNGFVVAPDGTIVKASAAGHLSRQSSNPSSQNTHRSSMGRGSPIERERPFGMDSRRGHSRDMSPDRPVFADRRKGDRFGPPMDGGSHRERYHGPTPADIIDSPSSMHQRPSRRDHSFSPPHRRPLHISRSHSRSPSRSRTRSPHRWASPRGRIDSGVNGAPGFRQHSRSPNYKPEARMDRPRAYVSMTRNHNSPPRASRWIDGRKEVPEHFRNCEYRRGPGRSPPPRVFSRGHRFDLMNSLGRLKSDEYRHPTNTGRFPEFGCFGRGSGYDRKGDDRRENGDRYEILRSGKQYVNDGNMKRLHYDDESSFMAQNPRSRSSEFQRRQSPRAFVRGSERQIGDSPRRPQEEKSHLVNGSKGNHNANFKSFGLQDSDDTVGAQRRPL